MFRFALHGGAGDPADSAADQSAQFEALRGIAGRSGAALQAGAGAVDVVAQAVAELEDCPLFNAGIGAVLNREGQPELDAAIMQGRSREAGAVAAVNRVRSPVALARLIMEHSPHLLMTGDGALRFARQHGLEQVEPEFFITEQRRQQLRQAQRSNVIALDHDASFGTVGAVALDLRGDLAAATSTGGLTNKYAGRIGDTPLIGAGTYADNRSLAISCTGTGECFIRANFAYQVHARMLHGGSTLGQACADTLQDVSSLGGRGGCIAIDRAGNMALPYNASVMYRAWLDDTGAVHVAIGAAEHRLPPTYPAEQAVSD